MFTIIHSHRRPAIAAILCLAVIVSGCGAGGHRSPTTSAAAGADGSPGQTTNASSRSTVPAPKAPAVAAGRVLKVLAGSGNARLETISQRVPVVVEWRSTDPVHILTPRGFLLLASPSSHGRIRLAAGTYRGLRIATTGQWRIALRSSR